MIKPAEFLNKYNTILFDMDGVLTSEQRYWDATALTVYEYLNIDINPSEAMANVEQIRRKILCNDETLIYLKKSGVNSNWDTTYIIASAALILGVKDDFDAVHDYIVNLGMGALEMYEYFGEKGPLGKRGGEKYHQCVLTFQEWYLGDGLFEEKWNVKSRLKGKKGLIWKEEPILPRNIITDVLETLWGAGFALGVGTGRVSFEIDYPFDGWNIRKYFDGNRLITYTDVINAEKKVPGVTLTKPNPYMFIKGMVGSDYDDIRIINGDYDKSLAEKTLVIGDAGADILAAQGADIDFAAVLTGVSGQEARGYFQELGSTYILNDISELIEGIEVLNYGNDKSYSASLEGACTKA